MIRKIKVMMKTSLLLSVFMLCLLQGYGQGSVKRPNVIVILTDDQGYGDFACHGNPVLRTQALDKLYNEGVRFSNFHVAPLCTPSRGQLMTGLDAMHNKALTVGAGRDIIRRDIKTMPQIFAENGYQTGIFGKWHLGDNYPDRPMDRGFQKAAWTKGWGLLSEAEFDNDYYKTRYIDGVETKYSNKYCTDLWFDEAKKWMGEMADQQKPFFTYLATNAPHGPFYSPEKEFNYFKNKGLDNKTAHFLGMIENIDWNMAQLEKWLEEKHLKENTLIVFMNDNGGTGGVDVFNAGMRGAKGDNYDGGHRAACFVSWPGGGFKTGRTVEYASQIQDLLPTFIDLFNLKITKKEKFDGRSLKSVLKADSQQPADRMLVVQYSQKDGPEKYFNCVVWNSWRLVGKNELYNITNDSAQATNVADRYPDVFKKMSAHYENWWKQSAQEMKKFVPSYIGASQENPVTLTCDYWQDSAYVNTQWKVAQAGGPSNGGIWNVYAVRAGTYSLELSRWPFSLNRPLIAIGPDTAIGGTALRKGVAVPIASGSVSLNGAAVVNIKKEEKQSTKIMTTVKISQGNNTLRAWFQDEKGKDLCGAYYLRVQRVGD